MTSVTESRTAAAVPLVSAFNRGIAVATAYSALLLLAGWFALPYGVPFAARVGLFAVCGFLAGTIAGFSNTQAQESLRRDLARNLCDAGMVLVWLGVFWLAVNLARPLAPLDQAAQLFGALAGAALAGAAIGEPAIVLIGALSIRGRRPFVAANRACERIHDPHARFVARVVLHTVSFLLLFAAAAAAAMVVMIVVALILTVVIGGWLLSTALNDGKTPNVSRRRRSRGDGEPAQPLFSLKRGQRLDEQGRIVDEHWYGDTPTGRKINKQGQLVDERWFGDEPTGVRIAPDGKLQKEGFLFDDDLGVRLVADRDGNRRVVKEGIFFDDDTSLRIDAHGRPIREGVLFDRDEGFEVDSDGEVKKS
jgi:hypothetical protein